VAPGCGVKEREQPPHLPAYAPAAASARTNRGSPSLTNSRAGGGLNGATSLTMSGFLAASRSWSARTVQSYEPPMGEGRGAAPGDAPLSFDCPQGARTVPTLAGYADAAASGGRRTSPGTATRGPPAPVATDPRRLQTIMLGRDLSNVHLTPAHARDARRSPQ
jgi:hypothetical protein